jgi:hypothetical protein
MARGASPGGEGAEAVRPVAGADGQQDHRRVAEDLVDDEVADVPQVFRPGPLDVVRLGQSARTVSVRRAIRYYRPRCFGPARYKEDMQDVATSVYHRILSPFDALRY